MATPETVRIIQPVPKDAPGIEPTNIIGDCVAEDQYFSEEIPFLNNLFYCVVQGIVSTNKEAASIVIDRIEQDLESSHDQVDPQTTIRRVDETTCRIEHTPSITTPIQAFPGPENTVDTDMLIDYLKQALCHGQPTTFVFTHTTAVHLDNQGLYGESHHTVTLAPMSQKDLNEYLAFLGLRHQYRAKVIGNSELTQWLNPSHLDKPEVIARAARYYDLEPNDIDLLGCVLVSGWELEQAFSENKVKIPLDDDQLTEQGARSLAYTPGGIDLPFLCHLGLVISIDGQKITDPLDQQLFIRTVAEDRYSYERAETLIYYLLKGFPQDRFLSRTGIWTKIDLEPKRTTYSLAPHYEWIALMTQRSLSEILSDPNIPFKIRRKLALVKLGLGVGPSIFIRLSELTEHLVEIVEALRFEGKPNIGFSTATTSDRLMGQMPSLIIPEYLDRPEIFIALAKYQQALDRISGQIPQQTLKETAMVDAFTNRWTTHKDRIVGGRLLTEHLYGQRGEKPEDTVITIEAAPGVWPRSIGSDTPGFINLTLPQLSSPIKDPNKYKFPSNNPLLNQAIYQLIDLLSNPTKRSAINTLMGRFNAPLVFDWYWLPEEGIIMIDFEIIPRKEPK